MAEDWSSPRYAEAESEPAIPPHAQLCLKHSKLYRESCPWCVAERMGYSLEMPGDRKHFDPGPKARKFRVATGDQPKVDAARELRRKGMSDYRIAKLLHVAVSTVWSWPT